MGTGKRGFVLLQSIRSIRPSLVHHLYIDYIFSHLDFGKSVIILWPPKGSRAPSLQGILNELQAPKAKLPCSGAFMNICIVVCS